MTYILKPNDGDSAPGIHILLVGVDSYPHLSGAASDALGLRDDLPELDAPSHSCALLGDWFSSGNLKHPRLPVRSIDVLATATHSQALRDKKILLEPPTFENVRLAITRWHTLGEASADNLLLFYFCGHGLQSGTNTHSLLCADFGAHALSPFDHAIHYEGLELGMRACAAQSQIFMIDACRTAHPQMMRDYSGPGQAVIGRRPPEDMVRVSQSVIWATSGGARAWAYNRNPSMFAQAFVKCLKGGAAINDTGTGIPVATAGSIKEAMAQWISAIAESPQEPQLAQPTGKSFIFHQFRANLKVPVVVKCTPADETKQANLSCNPKDGGLKRQKSSPRSGRWLLDLPRGSYTFQAVSAKNPKRSGEVMCHAHPPLLSVYIPMRRK
jgi:hypothetical protein